MLRRALTWWPLLTLLGCGRVGYEPIPPSWLDAGPSLDQANGVADDASVDAPVVTPSDAATDASPGADSPLPAVDSGPTDAPHDAPPADTSPMEVAPPDAPPPDGAPPDAPGVGARPSALLIVGTGGPNYALLDARLRQRGCAEVVLRTQTSVTRADVRASSLVVVSETVGEYGTITAAARDEAVPLILMEIAGAAWLFMLASGDLGVDLMESNVEVSAPGHPLADGLTGAVTVFARPATLRWGGINANGLGVLRAQSGPGRFWVFAYERGAAMPRGTAPARRLCMHVEDAELPRLGDLGWRLFDAAVDWSLGRR